MLGIDVTTTDIHDWAKAHAEDMVADVAMLVGYETPSRDLDLLDTAAGAITAWMRERLGEPDRLVRHKLEGHGDAIDVTYGDPDSAGVLLVGHYDTVWPAGTLAEWPFTIRDDGTATGPGAYDMKAGLVTAVWALRALRESGAAHPPVRFIFNGDEEIGSPVSRPVIEKAAASALSTLVLEPGVGWDVKTERKGVGAFTVNISGIESHAGNDPLGGASAIHAMAELIPELVAAQDHKAGTTINVGVIGGGTTRNVVAGAAHCVADVRASTTAEADRVAELFASLEASDPRIEVEVTGGWNRPPMQFTSVSRPLWEMALEVSAELREPLEGISVGGGSDANFIAALGLPVLDGLGASGGGPHARHEHIVLADVPDRAALVAGILRRHLPQD